ncbi:helix-turn-helix domain-containing protein [Methanophagales archaeon]|nr:MAG: helix-turn-helix domain-containing protein [Methanophagales archaeon]
MIPKLPFNSGYSYSGVERLGNVSEACRRARVSHSTCYRSKPRYEKEGVDGLS